MSYTVVSNLFPSFLSFSGLRKLEAFFGVLISVMAIAFGYEVCCVVSLNSVLHYAVLGSVMLVNCMTAVNPLSPNSVQDQ